MENSVTYTRNNWLPVFNEIREYYSSKNKNGSLSMTAVRIFNIVLFYNELRGSPREKMPAKNASNVTLIR